MEVMKETIENLVKTALVSLGIEAKEIVVEHPVDLSNGDYSTSAALATFRKLEEVTNSREGEINLAIKRNIFGNPKEFAEALAVYMNSHKPAEIKKIEVVHPGFINFHLAPEFFHKSVEEVLEKGDEFGKNESLKGEKVMVEHTDPNPFKEFHIGHLMPNVIGSTLARMFEWNGAEVKQANYQGDVGIHTAKAIYGMLKGAEDPYVFGNKEFEENEGAKAEIKEINKKIYERSDEKINKLYDEGKKKSLEYFDSIYKRLNSHFDYFFFESETAGVGKEVVEKNKQVFVEGENGAVVFHAEEYDPSLHTRVFINSEGLPTYEAKELGLAQIKFKKYPYTKSIVVTGNEIKDYFRVLLTAMKLIFPELREKTTHITHGMLRLPTGKMSSRTGDVITAENLIEEVKEKVKGEEEVAIGAIKYMILRQSLGNDIIFDLEKSVSTEGDSRVYLQYAYARTNSLLEKAKDQTLSTNSQGLTLNTEVRELERLLYRFPEIVERSMKDFAPNYLVTYLIEIAGSFNNLYAHEQIISDSHESIYLLKLTRAFNIVLKNGLTILGIPAPEKM